MIRSDKPRSRRSHVGDARCGLTTDAGIGVAHISLEDAPQRAQPGAGKLSGGGSAVLSGGGGAGDIGESPSVNQQRAALRSGKSAAGRLEECYRADQEERNTRIESAKDGVLHDSIVTSAVTR